MKLIKRNVDSTIPRFFDDFFTRDVFNQIANDRWNSSPAVNISQTEDSFGIEVAAPGLNKENFKIEVKDDLLTISYEDKSESEETSENGNYTRREFSYSSFSRSFNLPERTVDEEQVEANYVDGVLKIVLPKLEESKPKAPRTISVK